MRDHSVVRGKRFGEWLKGGWGAVNGAHDPEKWVPVFGKIMRE
jgi:hypothetical protein